MPSIDIEIEGITVIAYIDMKGENSYITSGVLKLLTYEENEIKHGRALIPIQDEYLLTEGYFKQLYFFCGHVIMEYPMYIASEEEEEEEVYMVLGRDWLHESQVRLCKKKTNHKEYLRVPYWKGQQLKYLHLPLYEAPIITPSQQLYENMLIPDEDYTYDNENEKDDNEINEAMLIDLDDRSDDITNNAPFISSPILLDLLDLDNEIFQQTFTSNQRLDPNKVKEVVTKDLETLYDNIIKDDSEKRKSSIENAITNNDDIIFLPPDELKLTKLTSEVTSKDYQMSRKQQDVSQWILGIENKSNQKGDFMNHMIKNNEKSSDYTSTEEYYATTEYSESSYKAEESYNSAKRKLMDVYFINTQQEIDKKIQKSTGIQYKKQKLKEGKCFICDKKGHKMKNCKWKAEFRKHERYCQKYRLEVWEKWKELWPLLH
ncbi:MAG TPA: hypothetical protein VM682_06505 [Bacillus sp. (in: firmicutes)]|nr:hypothetical protein [Bacillus sp. (in: firmicutes)]